MFCVYWRETCQYYYYIMRQWVWSVMHYAHPRRLVLWLKLPVWKVAWRSRVRPPLWPSSFKETKCFYPAHSQWFNIAGNLCDREVACSTSDYQSSHFQSCVWRAVSFHSSLDPQGVLLPQFCLYVHKGGLKPHHLISFHFHSRWLTNWSEKLNIITMIIARGVLIYASS